MSEKNLFMLLLRQETSEQLFNDHPCMKNLQDIFNRIQSIKKEQRELRAVYNDTLRNSQKYQELKTQIKELGEKKKSMENAFKNETASEMAKLENLKNDLATDMEMLTDVALNTLIKGEKVEVLDADENKYEPEFKVSFKRVYG